MASTKTTFFCQNCGAQSPKWVGKCSSCAQWNTFVEERITKEAKGKYTWNTKDNKSKRTAKPVHLAEITETADNRIQTPDDELNRVLGGGIVSGSLVLIGGEPGIGKSTLMLQLALELSKLKILYVTGEESENQIKMRANRLGIANDQILILAETATQNVFKYAGEIQPSLVIIDSIQTLHSPNIESTPGSVSQVRECTGELQRFAKETSTPVFIIGHITKDGAIAGPKVLEHIVDTVLQFEGDRNHIYRLLRTTKNRFGSTSELGIYEMTQAGLSAVKNPSELLLGQREAVLSGVAVAATIEGMRPMLIETQALVSTAFYGTPQRSATGFDTKRLNMLLAVLEKRAGFHIGAKDVFLNIAGGIRVEDPAIDLAIICALISSHEDEVISPQFAFAGEIGLSGEVRAVSRIDQRISEAEKLGFGKIIVSKYNKKIGDFSQKNIEIIEVAKVQELVGILF